jgi:hypothetical protein
LGEGEYIEEDVEMFVETKVGEFSFSKTKRVGNTGYEAIVSGDIMQKTQVEKDAINETYRKFSEKYGIKTPPSATGKAAPAKTGDRALSSTLNSVLGSL